MLAGLECGLYRNASRRTRKDSPDEVQSPRSIHSELKHASVMFVTESAVVDI